MEDHEEICESFIEALNKAKAKLKPYKEISPLSQQTTPMGSDMGHMKLPAIELPTFNGDIDKWLHFRDMFSALVHSKPNLPPIQKFHYLKSVLSGIAAEVIQFIEVTTDNYEIAWELLTRRYRNNIQLVQFYYNAILELQFVRGESFVELQRVHDSVRKSVRALQSLGRFSESLEFWIISIVCKRLDSNSRKDWQMLINGKEIEEIKLDDFFEFLENKIMALKAAYGSEKKTDYKSRPNMYNMGK
ncbi:PREDICTED: uncharacterized protein LOC108556497, partial [Nicrophorus vespilloides]|uniref:Uncharacterized protein LOC108556497 n=1 Tax=Nicrophorus vespilloides TaxID=110193 RepID=A0ABM1M0M0_NICVS